MSSDRYRDRWNLHSLFLPSSMLFKKMMDVDQKFEGSTFVCWREGMKGLHETHFIIIPVKILPLLMPRRRAEK